RAALLVEALVALRVNDGGVIPFPRVLEPEFPVGLDRRHELACYDHVLEAMGLEALRQLPESAQEGRTVAIEGYEYEATPDLAANLSERVILSAEIHGFPHSGNADQLAGQPISP